MVCMVKWDSKAVINACEAREKILHESANSVSKTRSDLVSKWPNNTLGNFFYVIEKWLCRKEYRRLTELMNHHYNQRFEIASLKRMVVMSGQEYVYLSSKVYDVLYPSLHR